MKLFSNLFKAREKNPEKNKLNKTVKPLIEPPKVPVAKHVPYPKGFVPSSFRGVQFSIYFERYLPAGEKIAVKSAVNRIREEEHLFQVLQSTKVANESFLNVLKETIKEKKYYSGIPVYESLKASLAELVGKGIIPNTYSLDKVVILLGEYKQYEATANQMQEMGM